MDMANCERCNKPLWCGDEMVMDFLEKEYPNQKICYRCDLEIYGDSQVVRKASLLNKPPREHLKELLKQYGVNCV